jgi:hypothetical protein
LHLRKVINRTGIMWRLACEKQSHMIKEALHD